MRRRKSVRCFFVLGGKPKKAKHDVGRPETLSADTAEEGPGIERTLPSL